MYGMDEEGIFEQLLRLLQSTGPVNWKLAREVTKSLAGPPSPIEPSVAEEYRELAHVADMRLSAHVDLPSASTGDLNPTDRATWAAENQQAFRILVEPLADKLTDLTSGSATGIGDMSSMGAMIAPLGPALIGVQAGTMVGFMAHRALGQFDTGMPAMDHDRLYVIVPNLDDFAIDHGIDHRQVRLWAAMHEVAFHRIMAVEWVRGRFVSLIEAFYDSVEIDTADLLGKLASLNDPAELQRMFGEGEAGDPTNLIKGTSDPDRLADVQAFTSFIDGYADRLVRVTGGELLPSIDRIEAAYAARRAEPDQAEQFLQQFAGLTIERWRAADAAAFCDDVVERWGEAALGKVWDHPDSMPTLTELTDPIGWAARVLLDDDTFGEASDTPDDAV